MAAVSDNETAHMRMSTEAQSARSGAAVAGFARELPEESAA